MTVAEKWVYLWVATALLLRLRAYVPAYYGKMFVAAETCEVEEPVQELAALFGHETVACSNDSQPTTVPALSSRTLTRRISRTRKWTLNLPEGFASVTLSNADLFVPPAPTLPPSDAPVIRTMDDLLHSGSRRVRYCLAVQN